MYLSHRARRAARANPILRDLKVRIKRDLQQRNDSPPQLKMKSHRAARTISRSDSNVKFIC